jgi:hypothetical protein
LSSSPREFDFTSLLPLCAFLSRVRLNDEFCFHSSPKNFASGQRRVDKEHLSHDEDSRTRSLPMRISHTLGNCGLGERSSAFQYVRCLRATLYCDIRLLLCLKSAARLYLTDNSGLLCKVFSHVFVHLLPCPSPVYVSPSSEATPPGADGCFKSLRSRLCLSWVVDAGK